MRLGKHYRSSDHRVNAFVRTHRIDAAALRRDDFRIFFNRRFEALLKLIERAMGKPANRTKERDESPFFEPESDPAAVRERVIRDIAAGESLWVEFKSTAIVNLHTGRKDVVIEEAILKTICAFRNTEGGTLLVGVADDGSRPGIEADHAFVKGKDRDGWERRLVDLIRSRLGAAAADAMRIRYAAFGNRTVARIEVDPAPQPVFLKPSKGAGEVLYARVGNTSVQKKGPDLLQFKEERWPD